MMIYDEIWWNIVKWNMMKYDEILWNEIWWNMMKYICIYWNLWLKKKSGQNERPKDRRTDRPTDQQTNRPIDRQTDWPTDRLTDRPTDIVVHREVILPKILDKLHKSDFKKAFDSTLMNVRVKMVWRLNGSIRSKFNKCYGQPA